MNFALPVNKKFIFILPAFAVLIYHCFAMLNLSTFYSTRIDPDYPYLFNGLNCALGAFDRIGHFDHPGTPFQMLTGLFILILHFIAGQDELATDVIARPEFYLTGCSLLLSFLASFVSFYTALKTYSATKNFSTSLVIGSSLLLYTLAMNLSTRYIPDYFLLILILLLAVPIVQYIYNPKYSSTRFAIFTGIIAGIGVITKIVFIPIVIIPFIMVDKFRNKMFYSVVFAFSAFLNFLPILSRLPIILKYYISLSKHDGIYNTGELKFLSIDKFLNNLQVFSSNETWFFIFYIGIVVFLVITYLKHKPEFLRNRTYKFLIAYVLSSAIGLFLILKHYKKHYAISLLALTIIAYVVLWIAFAKTSKRKNITYAAFVLITLIHFTFQITHKIHLFKHQKAENLIKNTTNKLINSYIDPEGYKIIKPSWQHNLTIDCGIVFGVTYLKKKHELYNELYNAYPKTLTWEGKNKPIRFMRITPFFENALFYSGQKVYFMPGKFNNATDDIIAYLKNNSEQRTIKYSLDTVFYDKYSQNYLVEYNNQSLWHTKSSTKCGFEITQNGIIMANDGVTQLSSNPYQLESKYKNTGKFSLCLSNKNILSPGIYIDTLNKNDYLKLTVKIKADNPTCLKDLVGWNNKHFPDSNITIIDSAVTAIDNEWKLVQLGLSCNNKINNISCISIVNNSSKAVYIDDFELEHYALDETNCHSVHTNE